MATTLNPKGWPTDVWGAEFKNSAEDMKKMKDSTTSIVGTVIGTTTGTSGLHPSSTLGVPMHLLPVESLSSLKIYKLPSGELRIVQEGRVGSFSIQEKGLSRSSMEEHTLSSTSVCIGTVHDLVYKLSLATRKKSDDEEMPF